MGEVVELYGCLREDTDAKLTEEYDQFLVQDGLDLLHAYRCIENPVVRHEIMSLIKALAADGSQK